MTLYDEVKSKHKDIVKLAKGGDNVELKATFTRSGVADNDRANELSGIGQLGHRKMTFRDLFAATTITNKDDSGYCKYIDWDADTIARAAAAIAEGGTFPESTAAFIRKSLQYKKTGDTLVVTEEVLEDDATIALELPMFLQNNVELSEDNDFINGDGTGENITGILAQVDAYVPAAASIQDCSISDLVVKVKEDITTDKGSKYSPDFVLMNISDINKFKLKKDANNNYVMPPFVDKAGNVIDGLQVVENNALTANSCVIGDRRYGRIYDKSGYVLSRDYVGTQFNEDKITLKGRKRSEFLIRYADKSGFRKVTDISTALTTLASDPA